MQPISAPLCPPVQSELTAATNGHFSPAYHDVTLTAVTQEPSAVFVLLLFGSLRSFGSVRRLQRIRGLR
ncbi:hypothetical protein PGIGA_G00043110 [Pangasianodon gigas]|uniref:Uncharacterized protein n=1 Tax=Pangasianodon gigas TaxID=30993 RepID=A0ACC5X0Q5_PANGG|nr:hypothetical protein [Pangasianodon gigas]